MALFKKPQRKLTSKQEKIKLLQNNAALFGQLYVAICRAGMVIWMNYLRTKYSPYSRPSLSDFGKLHVSDTMSDLLQCLEQPEQSQPPSTNDCELLDRAAVIHYFLLAASTHSLTHSLLRLTS